MTLRLVADNPRVTPSSDLERDVRRISFAGCSLQRDAAELGDDDHERRALCADVGRKLEAAIAILRRRQGGAS